jgi:hypothetical protein
MRRTAASAQWPQPGLQEVAAQEEHPDFPPAKADISLWIFFDRQDGQARSESLSLDRTRSSKRSLHFLHSYS